LAPSVQRRKVWLTPNTGVLCSNAAKTRKPLKFAGVLQINETILAASGPKFIHHIVGHVEEILLLKKFFPIVDACFRCEDKAGQSCAMVPRWRFFASCIFSKPRRVQHISDLHSLLALRPHHVWKYGRHPISDRSD